MDLRQPTTLRAVAELGSLSKASDRLRIAQPALSRQIKLLEHDLRTRLFVRHGRGMVLTQSGRMLLDRTAGLIRQLELARDDVRSAVGAPTGSVVVGMVPTVGSALALSVASAVVDTYPGITLRLVDAYGSFLVDWLHRGEVDMAVIYGPASALHLDTETLRTDELHVIGRPGSGVADMDSATFGWLATQPLVLPSAPHALRLLVDAAFARADLHAQVRVEANSFQGLIDLVSGGIGVTILPLYAVSPHLRRGAVEAAPLRPALSRELVFALPQTKNTGAAQAIVADIVRTAVRGLSDGLDG